ncbi:MAG TPA: VanW family protein [Acidimicrobiia bacterium]|nr:VanW family protein [Acidimicrobiia bacterium]
MRRLPALFVLALTLVAAAPAAAQEDLPPGGSFYDDQGSVHESAIEGLAASGITRGCEGDKPVFCPDDPVTRGQMAAFLDRAFELPSTDSDHFTDTDDSIFEESINRIAEAEITKGCNPPSNSHYCPHEPVTRGEMATFLVRALELPPAEDVGFTDIDDTVHRDNIEALAAADITRGCNPPDNTSFCPEDPVTRAQMASFLVRALPDLELIEAPPLPDVERVSRFTTYHDCCEPRVHNIQLIADTLDGYVVYPGEEFSVNDVVGPRTRAKGYVAAPVLCSGGLCEGIGGGISQFATTIFNAIFWGGYEEITHRPHSIWIDRYPVGIEATLGYPSLDVAFRNDTVTPVTIRTRHTATSITVELWGNAGGWEMSGYHPLGARSSVIDIIDDGGSDGRKVSGRVTGSVNSAGGSVRVDRTINQNGDSETETWWWTYR